MFIKSKNLYKNEPLIQSGAGHVRPMINMLFSV